MDGQTNGLTNGPTNGPTDGPTNGQTDIPSYRDVWEHIKKRLNHALFLSFFHKFLWNYVSDIWHLYYSSSSFFLPFHANK